MTFNSISIIYLSSDISVSRAQLKSCLLGFIADTVLNLFSQYLYVWYTQMCAFVCVHVQAKYQYRVTSLLLLSTLFLETGTLSKPRANCWLGNVLWIPLSLLPSSRITVIGKHDMLFMCIVDIKVRYTYLWQNVTY